MARALAAGADAAGLHATIPPEQFFLFAPPTEQRAAHTQLTALGRFASTLLSHMAASETGVGKSQWDRDTGPRVLRVLLAAGADVGAPLHCTSASATGPWRAGSATLVDALRLIVVAAKRNDQIRRARAAFVAPALVAALGAATHVSALDLCFWAALPGGADVVSCVAARSLPVLMPSPGGTPLWLQPPLVAAVDCGSVVAVKLLLEAGSPADDASWSRAVGVDATTPGTAGGVPADAASSDVAPAAGLTPLMRCTGEWAVALPPPEAFGAHRGEGGAGGSGGTGGGGDEDTLESDALVHRPTRALVEALLHGGASVASRDAQGRTPLHHFAASPAPTLAHDPAGRLALALRLMAAGADEKARDAQGCTPAQAAAAARPDESRFGAGLAAAAAEVAERRREELRSTRAASGSLSPNSVPATPTVAE